MTPTLTHSKRVQYPADRYGTLDSILQSMPHTGFNYAEYCGPICTFLYLRNLLSRRPQWLGGTNRWSACLSIKSLSFVGSSLTECMVVETVSCKKRKNDWLGKRESVSYVATFNENRRALGMLNPMRDYKIKARTGGGGGGGHTR